MARDGFHDVLFPVSVSIGAIGGPRRKTDIVTLASGAEVRRSRWSHAMRSWDVAGGIRNFVDAEAVLHFFEARQGRRYAFAFKDPFDHSSAQGGSEPHFTDQSIGMGDGSQTEFALTKDYGGAFRSITLAANGTVRVGINGVESGAWQLAPERDKILFDQPPSAAAVVTAGFEFDTPVRFAEDTLNLQLGAQGAKLPEIGLVEVRL